MKKCLLAIFMLLILIGCSNENKFSSKEKKLFESEMTKINEGKQEFTLKDDYLLAETKGNTVKAFKNKGVYSFLLVENSLQVELYSLRFEKLLSTIEEKSISDDVENEKFTIQEKSILDNYNSGLKKEFTVELAPTEGISKNFLSVEPYGNYFYAIFTESRLDSIIEKYKGEFYVINSNGVVAKDKDLAKLLKGDNLILPLKDSAKKDMADYEKDYISKSGISGTETVDVEYPNPISRFIVHGTTLKVDKNNEGLYRLKVWEEGKNPNVDEPMVILTGGVANDVKSFITFYNGDGSSSFSYVCNYSVEDGVTPISIVITLDGDVTEAEVERIEYANEL